MWSYVERKSQRCASAQVVPSLLSSVLLSFPFPSVLLSFTHHLFRYRPLPPILSSLSPLTLACLFIIALAFALRSTYPIHILPAFLRAYMDDCDDFLPGLVRVFRFDVMYRSEHRKYVLSGTLLSVARTNWFRCVEAMHTLFVFTRLLEF